MESELNADLERASASWLVGARSYTAQLDVDTATLWRCVEEFEGLLRRLPEKSKRRVQEQSVAIQIHKICRRNRQAFLQHHAREVYQLLVADWNGHRHLSELAEAAARQFPGLVPTAAQISAERAHLQRDKEGREIDQAIFFGQLLAQPDIGVDLTMRLLQPTAKALALLPAYLRDRRIHLGKVELKARGQEAHLTIDSPACLNAEDDELIDQMETAVDLALLDESAVVALLRGATMTHPRYRGRRVFSAGINLKDLHRGQISYADFLLRREFGYLNKMAHGLRMAGSGGTAEPRTIEKPWVAAVDSFAIGGGAQVLLVCDHVIASSESYFSLPAAQEGIVPGVANLRLPRIAGSRMARQIILLGRRVWARESQAAVLFDEVVEAAHMDATIDARLKELSGLAVIPNRRLLGLCEEPLDLFRSYMAHFAMEQATRLYSQDVFEKIERA
jgi:(3,5-dihydroxyphenyl)acetyl-CoA 1,2-dioxygenase